MSRSGPALRVVPDLVPRDGRIPPHDLDAEAAVLSACMLSEHAVDTAAEMLAASDFYSEANRAIFEAICALAENSGKVDLVTVASWLRDRERIGAVGGMPYLAQLADATPAVSHVSEHATTVREKARVRRAIATCQMFAAEGYGDVGGYQQFLDELERAVFEIARVPTKNAATKAVDAMHAAADKIRQAQQRGGAVTGAPTGFELLDRKTAGMHPGDLIIVAGRPGMGKTSFVLNVAVNVAEKADLGVLFFSLEMPREQLGARLLSGEARIDATRLRTGELRPGEWGKIREEQARIGKFPIWIDDTPGLTMLEIRGRVRRLMSELSREDPPKKLGLVVIDYLQLMGGQRQRGESREQEISENTRRIKALAKELGVPFLVLSQLNRSVEARSVKDKRPQLADLRESGSIEQDSDTIIFVYRDEYYFRDSPDKGIAELIVAKQRNGPTGIVKVKFTGEFTRFDNLAPSEYDFADDFSEDGMP